MTQIDNVYDRIMRFRIGLAFSLMLILPFKASAICEGDCSEMFALEGPVTLRDTVKTTADSKAEIGIPKLAKTLYKYVPVSIQAGSSESITTVLTEISTYSSHIYRASYVSGYEAPSGFTHYTDSVFSPTSCCGVPTVNHRVVVDGNIPPGVYNYIVQYSFETTTGAFIGLEWIDIWVTVTSPVLPDPPIASFRATPLSGTVPLRVSFENISSGQLARYLWSFGDGSTSTERHPIHVYNTLGKFTVELSVWDVANQLSTTVAQQYITVEDQKVPELHAPPDTIYFGNVFVGDVATKLLELRNTGNGDASSQQFTLLGADRRVFETDSDRLYVPAEGVGSVRISATPTKPGPFTAVISIDFNFAYYETVLIGEAVQRPPRLELDSSNIDFSTGELNTPQTQQLRIYNTGETTLSITGLIYDDALFTVQPQSIEIDAGGSASLDITFLRSISGSLREELVVVSNDPGQPQSIITLLGTVLLPPPPEISDFGNEDVQVGLSPDTLFVADTDSIVAIKVYISGMSNVKQVDVFLTLKPMAKFDLEGSRFVSELGVSLLSAEAISEGIAIGAVAAINGTLDGSDLVGTFYLKMPQPLGEEPISVELTKVSLGHSSVERDVIVPSGNNVALIAPKPPSAPTLRGPIVFDFSATNGDQGLRRVANAYTGRVYVLEMYVEDAPKITGWSAKIDYNPDRIRYVPSSFTASGFIEGITPLVAEKAGEVEVGGAALGSLGSGEGDGLLGKVSFEILPSFGDSTQLVISEIAFRTENGEQRQSVYSTATIASDPSASLLPGDFSGDGEVDFSDFFMFADGFGSKDARYDLDGSGEVDFSDFFIFADNFGREERAKLLLLAHTYIGLPTHAFIDRLYPNPFNSAIQIQYTIPFGEHITIEIYNLAGQMLTTLADEYIESGKYSVVWSGLDSNLRSVGSGLYFVRLQTSSGSSVRKMILVR